MLVAVLAVLAFLFIPAFSGIGCGGEDLTTQLNSLRQLQFAAQTMALDGEANSTPTLSWPGYYTYSNWTATLVAEKYVSEKDLLRFLSHRKIVAKSISATNGTAVRVYAVRDESPSSTVLLTSANFTYTPKVIALDGATNNYPGRLFVIFRKGGEGAIYRPTNATQTNVIGESAPLLQ